MGGDGVGPGSIGSATGRGGDEPGSLGCIDKVEVVIDLVLWDMK